MFFCSPAFFHFSLILALIYHSPHPPQPLSYPLTPLLPVGLAPKKRGVRTLTGLAWCLCFAPAPSRLSARSLALQVRHVPYPRARSPTHPIASKTPSLRSGDIAAIPSALSGLPLGRLRKARDNFCGLNPRIRYAIASLCHA